MFKFSTFVESQVVGRWGIVVLLNLHPPHRLVGVDREVPQSVFVFHSKSVAIRQGKTLGVNFPREKLEMFHNLLIGPQHHLNCI